jgi:hypothetical protein
VVDALGPRSDERGSIGEGAPDAQREVLRAHRGPEDSEAGVDGTAGEEGSHVDLLVGARRTLMNYDTVSVVCCSRREGRWRQSGKAMA